MDGLFYLDNTLSYGVENGASLRLDQQSLQASRRETKNTSHPENNITKQSCMYNWLWEARWPHG